MVYGVFNELDEHLYTFDYGMNTEIRANELAKNLSLNYSGRFYARPLTSDEYYDRLKDIRDGKFK